MGELSQMQQHRLGSEAHDGEGRRRLRRDGGEGGDGHDEGGLTKWMTPSRNMTSSLSSSSRRRAAPLSQAVFDGFYTLFLFSV